MKRASIVLFVCLLLTACGDTTYRSSVPSYPVSLEINIAAEYPHFVTTNTGAYLTFTEKRYETDFLGFGGVLIYIGMDAQYHAFDMGCPVCLLRDKPVTVDGMYACCNVCGEQYDLSYGLAVPVRGVSHEALRRYTTTFNGVKLVVR